MDDDVIGYVIILSLFLGGSIVITILALIISLFLLVFFILLVPLIIFGYLKTRNKRKCPYCFISMEGIKEEDKIVYQCPECSRIFKDAETKHKQKKEKQDYRNLNWLKHQYFDLEKSIQEIANEQHVSMITIQKWVEKLENKLEERAGT
jgi:hypothetical protein